MKHLPPGGRPAQSWRSSAFHRLTSFITLLVIPLLLSVGAYAQPGSVLMAFTDVASAQPPGFADDGQAVVIDSLILNRLVKGDRHRIQIGETRFSEIEILGSERYLNGDVVHRARGHEGGEWYSLVLTQGTQTLFGHISSAGGSFQLYAVSQGDNYLGWVYQPRGLLEDAESYENDYRIPADLPGISGISPPVVGDPVVPQSLPLVLGNPDYQATQVSAQTAGAVETIEDGNLRITQQPSRSSVIVGGGFDVTLQVENLSAQPRSAAAEFFFVLEDSIVTSLPANCETRFTLAMEEIIYCDLGNLPPGQTRTVTYHAVTTADSKPHVFSTVFVGELRLDSHVNVVDDIRLDSDGDGISDFNEDLAGTDPHNAASVDNGTVVIDVMAFYTPGAAALYPGGAETRINQLISVANQVYHDSGVKITLRPVYHGLVNYSDDADMDTALDDIVYGRHPAFGSVDALRQRYGGDLVMLFRPLGPHSYRCGLANVGGYRTQGDFSNPVEKDYAYSHIGIDCPVDTVVAHELGHNMGLTHSHVEDGGGGTFPFSTGFGVDSHFVTLMAYPGAFHTDTRLARFSTPLADCLGFACGVDAAEETGADAVQSLNLVRYQIANYFPAHVPRMSDNNTGTLDNSPTSARIAIAATVDEGLSFTGVVASADLVDVIARVDVDERHIGKAGTFHVLLQMGDQVMLLDNEAGLTPWDGDVQNMKPYIQPGPLRTVEYLSFVHDYRVNKAFNGQSLAIYVAYKVSNTGQLVYTLEPLVLSFVD
ncbi:MAG: zinc-dependent metalloprotease family protein [Pseudohongiellaceae bacterium]